MKHTEFSGSVLYERKQVDKWETWKQSRQNGKTKELAKRSRYYQSMIDLQLIDKGQLYDELKRSYVIFICPFDLYGKGRHIYTFENICKEDGSISMGDEAVKIFLNAKGTLDDVSDELEAFLDYVAGKKPKDAYVERLEEAVKEAKKNREWRHEYMTLLMRDQENVKIGEKRGEEKMLMLMERLIKDKRFDDIARIKVDNGYRQKLYLEYHII
nr:Rpn family recombination-promoting nuclease/putative transposase [uncultured Acetatifactor sp.]